MERKEKHFVMLREHRQKNPRIKASDELVKLGERGEVIRFSFSLPFLASIIPAESVVSELAVKRSW